MIPHIALGTVLYANYVHNTLAFSSSFIPTTASKQLALGRSVWAPQTNPATVVRREHDHSPGKPSARRTLRVSMIFDFIKKRAQEGVEQTQNLVTAAQEGRLSEALKETSAYVKER